MNENRSVVYCPRCGSNRVTFQMFQENVGTKTVSKSRSLYKQKRHGFFWWVFIGSWWWIIDLTLWIFLFPFRAVKKLAEKRNYRGRTRTVERAVNNVHYKTMCLCTNCGHSWVRGDIRSRSGKFL